MRPNSDPKVCVARSVPGPERTLVGCSGGGDSTALLIAAAEALGAGRVVAGHVDHGLRAESADDAEFVRSLAERLGVPFRSVRLATIVRGKRSPEEAARDARRAALLAMARDAGCEVLLLAHHMDDVAETVLMRVATGTGPAGLVPMSGAPDGGGGIVRPFLALRREDLRRWLSDRGAVWREDPTNAAGNLRARMRNEAIPLLSDVTRRDVVPLLARAGGLADAWRSAGGDAAAEAWVERPAPGLRRLSPGWRKLHEVVRTAAIRIVLRELGRRAHKTDAESIDGVLRVADGCRAAELRIRTLPDGGTEFRPDDAVVFPLPRLLVASGPPSNRLVLRRLRAPAGKAEILDADAVRRPLRVRRAREGDRFHALGVPRPQRLTHFLQRASVPADMRRGLPVVEDGSGRIVWVPGLRVAAWAALRPETSRWLVVSAEPRTPPPRKR